MITYRRIRLWETFRLIEEFLVEDFSATAFFRRLDGVVVMTQRGATPDERRHAKEALDRLVTRAKAEAATMTDDERNEFIKRLDRAVHGIRSSAPPSVSELPLPAADQYSVYHVPGRALDAVVKPGTYTGSYTLTMRVHTNDIESLGHMMLALNMTTDDRGESYDSPQSDHFVSVPGQGTAKTRSIIGSAVTIRAKLHAYNFQFQYSQPTR